MNKSSKSAMRVSSFVLAIVATFALTAFGIVPSVSATDDHHGHESGVFIDCASACTQIPSSTSTTQSSVPESDVQSPEPAPGRSFPFTLGAEDFYVPKTLGIAASDLINTLRPPDIVVLACIFLD